MTIVIFIIVLAVLIFVHELGHFLAARACGIRVDAFAIGFGPKILSWESGGTTYSINLIPFGGYVKIFGENPDEESMHGPDSVRSFIRKPRWQQAIVLVAGVFFNFVFAWLLYSIIFASGVTATTEGFEKYSNRFSDEKVMITLVEPGSPADRAGIKVGDIILDGRIPEIQEKINSSAGALVAIKYLREDKAESVEVAPVRGIIQDKYAIGIAMQEVAHIQLPILTSVYEGAHYTIVLTKETAVGLYTFVANIFKGTADFSDVAGPVGIAGIVGDAAERGFTFLLMVTAIISLNLGVINLLPFPALDGGRLIIVAAEGVIRRRISHKFTNVVNTIGFVLLMMLMVAVTYKDIAKLVGN